jgi:hypothetical protein
MILVDDLPGHHSRPLRRRLLRLGCFPRGSGQFLFLSLLEFQKQALVQSVALLFALLPGDVKDIPHRIFQGQAEENARKFERLCIEFREKSILQVHGFTFDRRDNGCGHVRC